MIVGIGTDIVAVERFISWASYSIDRLECVFSVQEISDCRDANGFLIPEKLAVRFAAKEAFYKALSLMFLELNLQFKPFSLRALCKFVAVRYKEHGIPILTVAWDDIEILSCAELPQLLALISLSHEKHAALAFVVLQAA